jgi:GNAT superfamily N-acetyltransferase
MARKRKERNTLVCHPLTPDRWADFEQLFGANGACGGCWCMVWRLSRKDFDSQKGEGNKAALQSIVKEGVTPGLMGYIDGEPVSWCAFAPRENYPALERSRILKPVDETPVWSISCFFVEKSHRKRGLSVQMLRAAVEYIRKHGGKVVEGYPHEPKAESAPGPFVWTGLARTFTEAGFVEVARRSDTRPIMRYEIG